MPLDIHEFSAIIAIVLSLVVVGLIALIPGQCLMMDKVGKRWWQGLIPGYNLYALFCGARCQVLFAAYLIDIAFVYGFWAFPEPEIQELVWWPLGISVVIVMWMTLCLAQRLHLGAFWQIIAFFLPSFAWCLMGMLPVRVDNDAYPWAVRPLVRFEHVLFEHPWEYGLEPKDTHDSKDDVEKSDVQKSMTSEDGGDAMREDNDEKSIEDAREVAPEERSEKMESNEKTPHENSDNADAKADSGVSASARTQTNASVGGADTVGARADDAVDSSVGVAGEGESKDPRESKDPGLRDLETKGSVAKDSTHDSTHSSASECASAYRGEEFDPAGDAKKESEESEPAMRAHMDATFAEEIALRDQESRLTSKGALLSTDDLSDEVASQEEGLFAEIMGYPEVTQAVDAEEAMYLETDAALAREQVLKQTHTHPSAHGYEAKHLHAALHELESDADIDLK